MVVAKSLQSNEVYQIKTHENVGGFYSRMKYLFNHHSFLNYMVLAKSKEQHLIKYTTLNQPYEDPEYFSIILRTNRFTTDVMSELVASKSISLNHLPLQIRDITRLYNFPVLQHEVPIKKTPFFLEPLGAGMKTACIAEASIRLGLTYDSHVEIMTNEMFLVKLKLQCITFDQVGYKRLTSPILNLKELLGAPIVETINNNDNFSQAM